MKGLIKKDILLMRNNLKIFLVLFIFYAVLDMQGRGSISFLLPFLSVISMLSTFSYDNYNKWTSYAITLPNGRKNVVRAKYITTFIIFFVTSILVGIISSIISYIKIQEIDYIMILANLFGSVFGTSLVLDFMYPIIFKLGIEKARIAIFVGVYGIVLIGGIIIKYVDFSIPAFLLSFFQHWGIVILFIIMISLLFLSYKISEFIYCRKEF